MSPIDFNPAGITGVNYIPRTVVNPYEMWSSDSFSPSVLHEELQWARDCGLNSFRVFLNHWSWEEDPKGFLDRFDRFLSICNEYQVKILPVVFDAVWNPITERGPQPDPVPGVHNSRWVQTPTGPDLQNRARHKQITQYYKNILHNFADDSRIIAWDLFNEPDNMNSNKFIEYEAQNKSDLVFGLLQECFDHAKQLKFNKPVTAGLYRGEWSGGQETREIDRMILQNSDIITFHNYHPLPRFLTRLSSLLQYKKPILCTEYMARTENSLLLTHLPAMRDYGVGAFSWGLAAGKTQTQFPWDSWQTPCSEPPDIFFHDLLHADGSPYDQEEISCIRNNLT